MAAEAKKAREADETRRQAADSPLTVSKKESPSVPSDPETGQGSLSLASEPATSNPMLSGLARFRELANKKKGKMPVEPGGRESETAASTMDSPGTPATATPGSTAGVIMAGTPTTGTPDSASASPIPSNIAALLKQVSVADAEEDVFAQSIGVSSFLPPKPPPDTTPDAGPDAAPGPALDKPPVQLRR